MPGNKNRIIYLIGGLFLLILWFRPATPSTDDKPLLWGHLEPGPYTIGFETLELVDHSRTFLHKYDCEGMPRMIECGRPMQISIWYPALRTASKAGVVFAEYIFPMPEDDDFFNLLADLQNREIYSRLFGRLTNSYALIQDLMNVSMAAIREAPPVDSVFPLVIYFPDLNGTLTENVVLFEYLASHGFVVAVSPSLGTYLLNAEKSSIDLETAVRDGEFIKAVMHDRPYVDKKKTGVIGHSSGIAAALLATMRGSDLDAVVSLAGHGFDSTDLELLRSSIFYNPSRMRIPHLLIAAGDAFDSAIVEPYRYSERYVAGMAGLTDDDLNAYGLLSKLIPDSTGNLPGNGNPRFEMVCRGILDFLGAYLNNDEKRLAARAAGAGDDSLSLTLSPLPATAAPPLEEQFVATFRQDGLEEARRIYDDFRESYPDTAFFRASCLNDLQLQYLRAGQTEMAVEIGEINRDAYPDSAEVLFILALSYVYNREIESALEGFDKLLELLPGDSSLSPVRKTELENYVRRYMEALKN